MDESGGDDDTGTKVLGKVKGLSVDGEARDSSCEDGEECDKGRGGPDDEDGTDTKTSRAGTVVHGTTALRLVGHLS